MDVILPRYCQCMFEVLNFTTEGIGLSVLDLFDVRLISFPSNCWGCLFRVCSSKLTFCWFAWLERFGEWNSRLLDKMGPVAEDGEAVRDVDACICLCLIENSASIPLTLQWSYCYFNTIASILMNCCS